MLGNAGFKKYFLNTSWLFVGFVVRVVVVLLTGILVTRKLGPELFGQLNYATGFVGIFLALTTMGLDEIMVRDLVRRPERQAELLGTSAMLKFLGAAVLFIIVSVGTFVRGMEPVTAGLVVVIGAAELFRAFGVIDWYFMANVQSKRTVMVQIIQVLLSGLAKVVLVLLDADLIWYAWVYTLETVSLSVGYCIAYVRSGEALRLWRSSVKMMGYLLNQSWPLIIFGLALYIQAKIDQVLLFDILEPRIGAKAANEEVGQYSNALKMIETLGYLSVMVQKSVAPAITRAKMQSRELYADRLVNQYRLMFLLFLVTAIPLFFLAEPLMVLLFGEAFRPSGLLLSLFAIRLFFTNMGVGKSSWITNESLFKYSLLTAVVGAVTNIGLNILLIPEYKSVGSIWAMIISFFISIFLLDLLFKNTRPNFKWMFQGIFTFWKIRSAA